MNAKRYYDIKCVLRKISGDFEISFDFPYEIKKIPDDIDLIDVTATTIQLWIINHHGIKQLKILKIKNLLIHGTIIERSVVTSIGKDMSYFQECLMVSDPNS